MAEELKAFRWLGPGTLYLTKGIALLGAVGPGEIVKDVEHLALLGAERIASFIKDSVAAPLGAKVEITANLLTPKEKADATRVVAESLADGEARKAFGLAREERAAAAGEVLPVRTLPTAPMAGPSRNA